MIATILQKMSLTTAIFIVIIIICAIYLHLKHSQSIAHKAPAFLTTLGILGTFTGIAFGLLEFDTNDIQKSLPDLDAALDWAKRCPAARYGTVEVRPIWVM